MSAEFFLRQGNREGCPAARRSSRAALRAKFGEAIGRAEVVAGDEYIIYIDPDDTDWNAD